MVGRKVATALAFVCSMSASEARAVSGWEVYGGDPGGRRYSALDQIDRSNVARL
jgi:glucose dehydrogenase